jgi:hypothetical protein
MTEAHSRWTARPATAAGAAPQHSAQPIPTPTTGEPVVIDCDRCTMRGIGCGDCVVTVLLGGPPYGVELDEAERSAIDALAQAGLVPPLRMVEAVDTIDVGPD